MRMALLLQPVLCCSWWRLLLCNVTNSGPVGAALKWKVLTARAANLACCRRDGCLAVSQLLQLNNTLCCFTDTTAFSPTTCRLLTCVLHNFYVCTFTLSCCRRDGCPAVPQLLLQFNMPPAAPVYSYHDIPYLVMLQSRRLSRCVTSLNSAVHHNMPPADMCTPPLLFK
jgi:hypothetical protein